MAVNRMTFSPLEYEQPPKSRASNRVILTDPVVVYDAALYHAVFWQQSNLHHHGYTPCRGGERFCTNR